MTAPYAGLTNALLGYPADARLLIVNADDFGMCHAIDAGILRAFREGIVSSTSLMMPCPWAGHALTPAPGAPDLAVRRPTSPSSAITTATGGGH